MSIQICEDIMLMNFLGAVNTAINGKFALKRANGRTEPVQLFVVLIGLPGERKSAAVALAKRPIGLWLEQQTLNERPILYFNNVSGPALIEALSKSNGRMACHEPEPTVLKLFARRDFATSILNNAYDAEQLILGRAGKLTIDIKSPAITFTIASQPGTAYDLGRRRDLAESGFLGRLLFVASPPLAGTRDVDAPPIPSEYEIFWAKLVTRLLDYPMAADGSRHMLTLSHAAEQAYLDFARYAEFELNAGRALSFDAAWGNKLAGKVLRLSVLLNCIEYDDLARIEISAASMRQAIEMSYVFTEHAREFFFQVEHGETLEVAQLIEGWAASTFVGSFSAQQAHSAHPRYTRRMIIAGIDMLVRLGRAYEDLTIYQNSTWRRGRKAGPFYRLVTLGSIAS
jgi:hypothetical protein